MICNVDDLPEVRDHPTKHLLDPLTQGHRREPTPLTAAEETEIHILAFNTDKFRRATVRSLSLIHI